MKLPDKILEFIIQVIEKYLPPSDGPFKQINVFHHRPLTDNTSFMELLNTIADRIKENKKKKKDD